MMKTKKKYTAKLLKNKSIGGYVFNRWSKKTGMALKSMMVKVKSKKEAMKYIRKKHTLRRTSR